MSATEASENVLGKTIKTLLKVRGLKAYELGEAIGLSPTSVSKIINGVTRPRQNTFTRMCQALCKTKDEERRLVAAFAGTELLDEEPDDASDASNKEILRLRTEQFMERKTQSIQFKRSVARALDQAGVRYKQDYCEGICSTDFLIEKDGKRIALECKANIGRDSEKAIAQACMVKEVIQCDDVYLTLPFSGGYLDFLKDPKETHGVNICEISGLILALQPEL